jgi:hypothetical protein
LNKQLDIFKQIKRCEMCNKSIEQGDVCSTECGEAWIEKYFPKITDNEKQNNKLD